MPLAALLNRRRDEILRIAANHGAENVRLFGSVLRGEDGADSDVDLLVTFRPGRSLLDQIGLTQDLEDMLGRPVDVVEEAALYSEIREAVVREARPL